MGDGASDAVAAPVRDGWGAWLMISNHQVQVIDSARKIVLASVSTTGGAKS
jgi:hypothetical protein